MPENSLSAAIAGNLAANDAKEKTQAPKAKKPLTKPKRQPSKAKASKRPSRANTVLVGAHVSPEVARQLKIIAAEDGTTNQELIEEALNLLFVKKGKAKIQDL